MALYSFFAKRAEETREVPFSSGFLQAMAKPFAITTGGRGHLITNLSAPSRFCTVPSSGDWTISEDCTLTQDATAPANVIVAANVTLTILQNVTLNVDFLNFHVKVKDTGKLVIKTGAKVD